jgi:hypothetical protein
VEEIVNDHHFSESELHRLITIHRRHAASHKCTVSAGITVNSNQKRTYYKNCRHSGILFLTFMICIHENTCLKAKDLNNAGLQ